MTRLTLVRDASRFGTFFYSGLGLLASIVLWYYSPFPGMMTLAIGLVIWGYLLRILQKTVWLNSPNAVIAVERLATQQWHLHLRSGNYIHAQLDEASWFFPMVGVSFFRCMASGRRLRVVFWGDALDRKAYRELRVFWRLAIRDKA